MVFIVIDGEQGARSQGGGGPLKEGRGVSEEACFLLKELQEWSPRGPGGASEAQEWAWRLRVPLQGEGQGVSRGLQGSCPRPAPAPSQPGVPLGGADRCPHQGRSRLCKAGASALCKPLEEDKYKIPTMELGPGPEKQPLQVRDVASSFRGFLANPHIVVPLLLLFKDLCPLHSIC